MITIDTRLRDYQRHSVLWALQNFELDAMPGCALWADPGLGKTLVALELIKQLNARRVIILAPKNIIHEVWPQQIEYWGYNYPYAILEGSAKQKLKAVQSPFIRVHLCSVDSAFWLYNALIQNPRIPSWDLAIYDEHTRFKTWGAKRTRAARKLLSRFKRRFGLTGTPVANGYPDLFAQMYLLDNGEALGKTITYFRQLHCIVDGWQGYKWRIRKGQEQIVEEKIKHLVLRLDREDHLDLPDLLVHNVWVHLPPDIQHEYDRLERKFFFELSEGVSSLSSSAAAKYAHCRSIANGGLYVYEDDAHKQRTTHYVHTAKIDAVESLIEELNGKGLLVAYQFHHDRDQLAAMCKRRKFSFGVIEPKQSKEERRRLLTAWNERKLHVLAGHPKSIGEGLNLQHGGNDLAWIGLTNQHDLYEQFIARLYRQGVTGSVRVHRILAKNTVDVAVLENIEQKGVTQKTLLKNLRDYAKQKALSNA